MSAVRYYFDRGTLFNAAIDFVLTVAIVMAAELLQAGNRVPALAATATQGFSLATFVLFFNGASGFYQPHSSRSIPQICARVALAALFAAPVAYVLFTLLPPAGTSRDAISLAALLGVGAVTVYRSYAAHSGAGLDLRSRIAVLGSGPTAQRVGMTLREGDPHADVIGYFSAPNEAQRVVAEREMLPLQGSLVETARRLKVDEIVVALGERRGGNTPLRELLDCKVQGIKVSDVSSHFEKRLGQVLLDHVNASWLVFGDGFNQGILRTAMKRASDIVNAVVLLALTLPIMVLTAVLIRIESRGPVLYRQQRVGRNGRLFDVVKFRSMCVDAEPDGSPRWADADDARITRVGKVIRLLRIDELPQLWNVLKGEMSLVGPRPERPYFVEQLTRDIAYYAVRHSVKPGLTGWAQVRYHYGATLEDSQAKLQYDLYYVKNHTLLLDLLILFETVAVVLTGKGAR